MNKIYRSLNYDFTVWSLYRVSKKVTFIVGTLVRSTYEYCMIMY
jgi:hypothetical protein